MTTLPPPAETGSAVSPDFFLSRGEIRNLVHLTKFRGRAQHADCVFLPSRRETVSVSGFQARDRPREAPRQGVEFPETPELATVRACNSFRTDFAVGLPKEIPDRRWQPFVTLCPGGLERPCDPVTGVDF